MFKDFSNFGIEDFAFDESFQKWVTDGDYQDFWGSYMNEHPHQIDKILAARELVQQLKNGSPSGSHEDLAGTIWSNVEKHIESSGRPLVYRVKWMYAAAAVAALLVAGYLFRLGDRSSLSPYEASSGKDLAEQAVMTEYRNDRDSVLKITLEDGSSVSLEKDSRLSYSGSLRAGERTVYLDGEAFFDVERDPKRPFVIFANKTVVKVLGTSFRVKAHDHSEKVVVAVKSGKVSVFERKDFEKARENPQISGLVLMANQQAEFSNELEKFSKMIVPDPVMLGGTDKKEFDFDRTPLPEVFSALEKAYGIEIIYDGDLLADRLLKVSLEDETLTEKLDVICKTMGLSYHIVDARIIIEIRNL
ncbi:MAG: hypothetical protein ABS46_08750 [Cytophagaceae bacterium SCN 52-12]|nr:MAG: hypothetical protein ABS46_08750 [Cytophagaceae bacterium SCN 52-12]